MQLIESNIVLLGGFNPHIIEPKWLCRHDVVSENPEEFEIEMKIQLLGPSAHIVKFELDGLRWEVSQDRILIGSDEAKSPLAWFDRLLKMLPHTPLRAVGTNFKLRCKRTDWPLDIPKLPNQDKAAHLIGDLIASTTLTKGQLKDETQVNLSLNANESEVVLDANFHRGVTETDKVSAIERALYAMGEYDGDIDRLRSIVTAMTGQEVE